MGYMTFLSICKIYNLLKQKTFPNKENVLITPNHYLIFLCSNKKRLNK